MSSQDLVDFSFYFQISYFGFTTWACSRIGIGAAVAEGKCRDKRPMCPKGQGANAPQVGSRTGAPALGSGGLSIAFALVLSPAPLTAFPVPATSNRTCRFPASGFPTNVTPRHTSYRLRLDVKRLLETPGLTNLEVLGLRHSPTLVSFHRVSEVRPLPSTGITQLQRYYAPVRHPTLPSLALADYQLVAFTHHSGGFPCCTPLLFHTCCRHYPGGIVGCIHRSLPQRRRPSLIYGQVGFRITLFEACSTFTHVTACVVAKSPKATRYIRGFSRFVASSTAPIATGWSDPCRVGFAPTEEVHLSTAHHKWGSLCRRECAVATEVCRCSYLLFVAQFCAQR